MTRAEAEAMARAVVKLFGKWKLSDGVAREILGGLRANLRALEGWAPGRIDSDPATRLSLLMGFTTGCATFSRIESVVRLDRRAE